MGVEYRHFLVVDDKDRLPAMVTLARVDAILRQWSQIKEPTTVFYLLTMKESSYKRIPAFMPGAGQALVYDDAAKGKPVENIAGQCYYDTVEEEDHYISTIIAVAGNDIRIQQSDDYCYFEQVACRSNKHHTGSSVRISSAWYGAETQKDRDIIVARKATWRRVQA